MRRRGADLLSRPLLLATAAISVATAALAVPIVPGAGAASNWRTLTYGGESFSVPSAWKVYDLSTEPKTCVRFDRHAVYEGAEGPRAACPSPAAGLSEAVQVQPLRSIGSWMQAADLRPSALNGQQVLFSQDGAVTHRLVAAFPAGGVIATISYLNDRSLAYRILDSFSATSAAAPQGNSDLSAATGGRRTAAAPSSSTGALPTTTSSPGSASAGALSQSSPTFGGSGAIGPVLYNGRGFDACGAPSESLMSAWRASSPYRAVGVYIGGVNAACPPDTTTFPSWVSQEANAGWFMFPLYVGLQAPCVLQGGLATISLRTPAQQGAGAADNAANEAQAFGMGVGSTIYYDMEAWDTANGSCDNVVVSFVRAWTAELHRRGYSSGLYGGALTGLNVFAGIYGTSDLPNDVDIADWDHRSTVNGYLPAADWAHHQRIHQYSGGVTQSYGGFALNLDGDYLDAPTVGVVRPSVSRVTPNVSSTGSQLTVTGTGFFPGRTSVDFGGKPSSGVKVASGGRLTATVPARTPATVDVTVTTSGGTSAKSAADRFKYVPFVGEAVDSRTGGYYLATSKGNVYAFHAPWEGSTSRQKLPAAVVAIAADQLTGGYFLVTSRGNVYGFNAPFQGSLSRRAIPAPVVAMAVDPATGGYYLATSKGNVYNFNAPWLGSTAQRKLPAPVVGIAVDAKTGGYELTTSRGNVYTFRAPWQGSTSRKRLPAPVVSISSDPRTGGYYLTTAKGNVYDFNAPFRGSRALSGVPSPVVADAVVSSKQGYLIATSGGNVYNFGADWYGSPAG